MARRWRVLKGGTGYFLMFEQGGAMSWSRFRTLFSTLYKVCTEHIFIKIKKQTKVAPN
jgi:hypothetical protein